MIPGRCSVAFRTVPVTFFVIAHDFRDRFHRIPHVPVMFSIVLIATAADLLRDSWGPAPLFIHFEAAQSLRNMRMDTSNLAFYACGSVLLQLPMNPNVFAVVLHGCRQVFCGIPHRSGNLFCGPA